MDYNILKNKWAISIVLILFIGSASGSLYFKDPSIEFFNSVDMRSNQISNLGSPSSPNHAATKGYVDSQVSSRSSGPDKYLPDNPPNSNIDMNEKGLWNVDTLEVRSIRQHSDSQSSAIILWNGLSIQGEDSDVWTHGGGVYTDGGDIDLGDEPDGEPGDLRMDGGNIEDVGSCDGCDLAEVIDASEPLETKEIVTLDSENPGQVKRSQGRYDTGVIGAVSSTPALTMGGEEGGVDVGSTEVTRFEGENSEVAVALTGVVPVNVTNESGAIEVGDEIVASSTPGKGMRADESDRKYSQAAVIGKAMEPLNSGKGTIDVLVR